MTYTPSTALTELMDQHEALRALMDRCDEIADELDADGVGPNQLLREVAKLRLAFDAHNVFEEQLLRPVLLSADAFGAARIERMIEEHLGEHREMRSRLSAGSPVTAELRNVIGSLRAHLAAEERYFLTSKVLRDDVVVLEGTG
jgi:hypothetical protein